MADDWKMSEALRNARAQAFADLVDAGSGPGAALLYEGTTLLARCACSKPFATVTGGVLTMRPFQRGSGLAQGEIDRVAFVDSDDTFCFSLRAATGNAPVIVHGTAEVYVGQPVEIESGRIVEPGA